MNKKYISFLFGLTSCILMGQELKDLTLFSQESLSGTARYTALSGAFHALGADLSAIAQNPAASAVFLDHEIGFTLGTHKIKNSSSFLQSNTQAKHTDFDISQAGMVFVFNAKNPDTDWSKFAFGFNYQNTQNYYADTFASGTGGTSSIADYFLSHANGKALDILQLQDTETIEDLYGYLGSDYGFSAQQAFLGYNAYLINPVTNNATNTAYTANVAYSSLSQTQEKQTQGYNRKFSFNFSTQYKKKLHVGATVNSHVLDYNQSTWFRERGYAASSDIQHTTFYQDIATRAEGISLQIGAIARITPQIRASLAYQSPIWYTLQDQTQESLTTLRKSGVKEVVAPNITNLYQEYKLRTPSVLSAGLAYVFADKALLSVSYTYKDYSTIQAKPKNDFIAVNQMANTTLQAASTFALGAEYRIDPRWSLRSGYRYQQSPFKDTKIQSSTKGYSFGLGYNFGATILDVAYTHASQSTTNTLYNTGLVTDVATDKNNTAITATLRFKL